MRAGTIAAVLLGALLLPFEAAVAEDQRYFTSYSRPLDATTDQQVRTDAADCGNQVRAAMSNGFKFRFGPPLWVDLHQMFESDKDEDRANAMYAQCMGSKGWREVNRKDIERATLKRGLWTNYPEPREKGIAATLTCIRDMASPDADSPGKPLRLDTAVFDQCMTMHRMRLVTQDEANQIRLLRHQQQQQAAPQAPQPAPQSSLRTPAPTVAPIDE